jgi:hypothetical protein
MRTISTIPILIVAVVAIAAPSQASVMQVGKPSLPTLSFDLAMYKKKKLPKIKFKWPSREREEHSEEPKHSIKIEEPNITKPKLTPSRQIARQKTEEETMLLFKDAVADLPQSLRNVSQQTLREEIEKRIIAILKAEVAKPKPHWTFQPTSGKLTINASLDFAGGRIEAPDVNVYVIAGLIAAGAAADQGCKSSTDWSDCVRKFIVSAIKEAMKSDDSD